MKKIFIAQMCLVVSVASSADKPENPLNFGPKEFEISCSENGSFDMTRAETTAFKKDEVVRSFRFLYKKPDWKLGIANGDLSSGCALIVSPQKKFSACPKETRERCLKITKSCGSESTEGFSLFLGPEAWKRDSFAGVIAEYSDLKASHYSALCKRVSMVTGRSGQRR